MTDRTPLTRAELEQAIKFVLEQNRSLCPGKWPKGPDGSAMAKAIADHFALSKFEVTRGPGAPFHSTPGPARDDGTGPLPIYRKPPQG